MKTELSLPMAVEMLIPHRPPLRLVDRLLDYKDHSGVLSSIVLSDNVLLCDDGSMDPLAMLELIAQAYAAVKGYEDLLHEKPMKKGFLVGIRKIHFKGRAFVGDRLRITVSTVGAIEGFAVVEGEVLREGKVIASGTIKLWITEDG
jgi:predicted hotdog family 3-hydroxylacyl-ACP dehydratase